jgi:hypothetical protein
LPTYQRRSRLIKERGEMKLKREGKKKEKRRYHLYLLAQWIAVQHGGFTKGEKKGIKDAKRGKRERGRNLCTIYDISIYFILHDGLPFNVPSLRRRGGFIEVLVHSVEDGPVDVLVDVWLDLCTPCIPHLLANCRLAGLEISD